MDRGTLSQSSPLSGAIGLRRRVASTALGVFKGWHYREIDVPLLDYFDPLRKVLDPELVNRMFRLVDRDGNLLVLRGDVTPAIAKIFAFQLSGAPLPLRVCYANKVVRIERAFTREQIENYQLGIELIGASGLGPEIEVILVALETLAAVGVQDYEMHIGSSAVADRLISLTGVGKEDGVAILQAVGRRDPEVLSQRLNAVGVSGPLADALQYLTHLSFDRSSIAEVGSLAPADDELQSALGHLQATVDVLEGVGVADRIHIDLGLVNDPGYYTGTTFKIVSQRVGRVLGGGGRYDGLIASFGTPTPAVGFSLSLEALLDLLGYQAPHEVDVAVAPQPVAADDLVAGFESALAQRRDDGIIVVKYDE